MLCGHLKFGKHFHLFHYIYFQIVKLRKQIEHLGNTAANPQKSVSPLRFLIQFIVPNTRELEEVDAANVKIV